MNLEEDSLGLRRGKGAAEGMKDTVLRVGQVRGPFFSLKPYGTGGCVPRCSDRAAFQKEELRQLPRMDIVVRMGGLDHYRSEVLPPESEDTPTSLPILSFS